MVDMSMEDFVKLDPKEIQLVDVREEREFSFFYIEWSKLIPKGDLVSRISELDKTKPLYIICRTWNRSMFMSQVMDFYGFETINILGWIEEYLRLKK